MKKPSPFELLAAKLQRGEILTAAEHNMLSAKPRPARRKKRAQRNSPQIEAQD